MAGGVAEGLTLDQIAERHRAALGSAPRSNRSLPRPAQAASPSSPHCSRLGRGFPTNLSRHPLAYGPDGLIDRKAPGQTPKLNDAHRAALMKMIEDDPTPAIHGVARWRIVDLCPRVFEEFRIAAAKQTMSRELRERGLRKLSARPRHHARAQGAIEDFKKVSRPARRKSRAKKVSHAAKRSNALVISDIGSRTVRLHATGDEASYLDLTGPMGLAALGVVMAAWGSARTFAREGPRLSRRAITLRRRHGGPWRRASLGRTIRVARFV